MEDSNKNLATIETIPSDKQNGIIINRRPRNVDSVEVLTSELSSIGAANLQFSLYTGLNGVAIGLLISSAITLATVEFAVKDIFKYNTFLIITILSAFMTVLFTVLSIINYRKSITQTDKIIDGARQNNEETIQIIT